MIGAWPCDPQATGLSITCLPSHILLGAPRQHHHIHTHKIAAGDTSSCTQEELTGMLADLHSVLRRLRAQLSSAVARRHRATRTPTLDGGGRGDGAAPKERAARPVKRRAPVPAATRTAAADSDDDDDDFEWCGGVELALSCLQTMRGCCEGAVHGWVQEDKPCMGGWGSLKASLVVCWVPRMLEKTTQMHGGGSGCGVLVCCWATVAPIPLRIWSPGGLEGP